MVVHLYLYFNLCYNFLYGVGKVNIHFSQMDINY